MIVGIVCSLIFILCFGKILLDFFYFYIILISTIQKWIKELYPEIVQNGKTTFLNEKQVTEIKLRLEKNPNLGRVSELPKTNLEKKLLVQQAMQILTEEIEDLKKENALMLPKVESFEALQRSDKNMSITECAKHFGLHPKTQVYPFLRAYGYLTSKDLPSQKAIDEGILIERQTQGNDGVYRGQAVVKNSALELWRTKIIKRIK